MVLRGGELVRLPQGLSQHHGRRNSHIERTGFRHHWHDNARIRDIMNRIRHPCAFASKEQNIIWLKVKPGIRHRSFCGQQYNAGALPAISEK